MLPVNMYHHKNLPKSTLSRAIKNKNIRFGGNKKLKIYGTLNCKSGKRMKLENRVFFSSEETAKSFGYRPCGHCMREKYKLWKNGLI